MVEFYEPQSHPSLDNHDRIHWVQSIFQQLLAECKAWGYLGCPWDLHRVCHFHEPQLDWSISVIWSSILVQLSEYLGQFLPGKASINWSVRERQVIRSQKIGITSLTTQQVYTTAQTVMINYWIRPCLGKISQ